MGPVVRRSSVILSDDEVAAQIQAEHEGQPQEWIADKIEEALAPRRAQAEALQTDYDKNPPRRPYAAPED